MNKKSGLADSPFFAATLAVNKQKDANERTSVRTPERTNERTPERVNGRTSERTTIRHSFQIYQDQLDQIKKVVAMKTIAGEKFQLSDIVKAALDDYLRRNSP